MKELKSNSPLEGMKIFHPTRTLTPYLRGSGKNCLDSEPKKLPNKGKNRKACSPWRRENPTKMDTSENEKGNASIRKKGSK